MPVFEVHVAPDGGVVAGRAYLINGVLVVADSTAGSGATFAAKPDPVEYAKVHEQAWKAGELLYWDAGCGCLSSVPTGRMDGKDIPRVGAADREAAVGTATGFARLAH